MRDFADASFLEGDEIGVRDTAKFRSGMGFGIVGNDG